MSPAVAETEKVDPATTEEAAAAAVPHVHGFRPTLRHQLILVAYFALLFAVLMPVVERSGQWASVNATVAGLLISPWLLAVLVLAFDRAGPLKHWLAPLLFATIGPMLALSYDVSVISQWAATGAVPRITALLMVNFFFFGLFALYLRQVGPSPCPTCSRKAFIPVYYLWGTLPRTRLTRWCAACGATYWRRARGDSWKMERRTI